MKFYIMWANHHVNLLWDNKVAKKNRIRWRAWVDAVRGNLSVAHLAPVDVEPTREWAAALASRLRLLEEFLAEED
jgi:hypothetical protein